MIDSAMDTDADSFSIDIGAPTPAMKFLLDRDTEVSASIFTSGILKGQVEHLHAGIADVVDYTSDDHIISIAGRDSTCLATDSQAPPGEQKHVMPHKYIAKDAAKLGITKLKLAKVKSLSRFYRDGSESYWESWYRMARKRDMWMWAEPNGTLFMDKLHYGAHATYNFGWPTRRSPNPRNWIPIERCQITAGKQSRVGEVWVFGEHGDLGFVGKATDPTIRSWKRKPLKIMTSSSAHNRNDARKEAWEEVFEGKVGALEITVTIPLSEGGRIIRQNTTAAVNIPDMGLAGLFFVVGCQLQGGSDGYRMVVRLRERNYAISRRKPDDPQLAKDPADQSSPGDLGDILAGAGIRWSSAFASAAQEFHNGWDYGLFLAVILSICKVESNFRNVRGGGDTEWYPKPGETIPTVGHPSPPQHDNAVDVWRRLFANSQHNPLNPRYPSSECAVGPMQLVTPTFKVWADGYGGKHDEYEGGRWQPRANIRAGARAFAGKLSGLDPTKNANIWIGVERYYGSNSQALNDDYRRKVQAVYKSTYAAIETSVDEAAKAQKGGVVKTITVRDDHGAAFDVEVPDVAPLSVKKAVTYALKQRGKPYQWGASGPNTFDCSGLAKAAYQAGGVSLPGRTTYDFVKKGALTPVTKDNLLPGDLVFFATGSDVHHMGMYLNDGHMIHAPHTGDVVKITAINQGYYREHYWGARRPVEWAWRGN